MSKVLLVQGLPGSGKTTLSRVLTGMLGAVHVNADWARSTVTSHLSFAEKDRVLQAKSLGQMARMIFEQGPWVVVDFVCPIVQTRHNFFDQFKERSEVYSVWMNTIDHGRFEDTNRMYKPPMNDFVDYEITGYQDEAGFKKAAIEICKNATVGHKQFYIRYNTKSDGFKDVWRVIDANTMEERLFDTFELRGHMIPATTLEFNVTKYNVCVTGYPQYKLVDGFSKFILNY
jgi:adenylylsulfate kinase